ncbi:MAG TPA: hypothetical protein DCZ69_04935 [Syntrophobacteraceae bacterium]|nr:hypothetical protein [Syntrophobacteraceae bacterium]
MSLKFRHKVFLTLLLNSLLIVVSSLLIARYFAFRHFERYMNQMDMERLGELAELLSEEYRKSQSWDSILEDPGHWHAITRIGHWRPPGPMTAGPPSFASSPPPSTPFFGGDPKRGGPPPHDERFSGKPPPPADGFFRGKPGKGGHPPRDEGSSPPPGPPPDHGPMSSTIALFDAEKKPLSAIEASSEQAYHLKPIAVDNQVVGWVGIRKHEQPIHPLDVEFIRHQSQTFYAIGGVALLLAIMVTFIWSRHLLAPVKELAAGTRALTSRRFETRLKVRSMDEFGQLAADFNAMAQALGRYEQMRRQWMADISHELRTPLSILRGEIEAMQDGVREISREALESLHFEVLHVSRIVHDLHDLSLIESQTYAADQTVVNPLDILMETLRSFGPRFAHLGMTIEAAESSPQPVAIMADADRLRQLFSNLLENTLRYAHAPGILKVEHQLTNDSVLLSFEDSGPGVPEEALGRLFDRLYRVDKARSRSHGGSGLGLAICKSIVESFRGRIEATNVPSGGLRIAIAFPLRSD